MKAFIKSDNQRVIVGKYFSDSSFSVFIHEFAKTISEDEMINFKNLIMGMSEDQRTKVKVFLEIKMRPIFYSIFEDEIKKRNEQLVFKQENSLNISFEPKNQNNKDDGSLLMNRDSDDNFDLNNSFLEKAKKTSKDSIEFNGNDSFSDDGKLKDLW